MQAQVYEMFDLCYTNEHIARVLDLPLHMVQALERAYTGWIEEVMHIEE